MFGLAGFNHGLPGSSRLRALPGPHYRVRAIMVVIPHVTCTGATIATPARQTQVSPLADRPHVYKYWDTPV